MSPALSEVLGVGYDLVHVPGFASQLANPGTVFAAGAFTARERRHAERRRALTGSADPHLAGMWAAKEAVVKAWSIALTGIAPPVGEEEFDWRGIEVVHDAWGRPSMRLARDLEATMAASLPGDDAHGVQLLVSISHDGDYAAATVLLGR